MDETLDEMAGRHHEHGRREAERVVDGLVEDVRLEMDAVLAGSLGCRLDWVASRALRSVVERRLEEIVGLCGTAWECGVAYGERRSELSFAELKDGSTCGRGR